MSSLMHLNKSIKLKRMEGKNSIREFDLNLNFLLFSLKKHVNKTPFFMMVGTSIGAFIFTRYKNKIRFFYPISSILFDSLKKHITK